MSNEVMYLPSVATFLVLVSAEGRLVTLRLQCFGLSVHPIEFVAPSTAESVVDPFPLHIVPGIRVSTWRSRPTSMIWSRRLGSLF